MNCKPVLIRNLQQFSSRKTILDTNFTTKVPSCGEEYEYKLKEVGWKYPIPKYPSQTWADWETIYFLLLEVPIKKIRSNDTGQVKRKKS